MTTQQIFQQRQERINSAIRCEPVDKLPLIWMGTATAPRQMGITIEEYIYEPVKGIHSQLDYMDKLQVDGVNDGPWFRPDVVLSPLWLSHLKMPGRELPSDTLWQVDEKQIMTVADYDLIIDRGFEAFMEQYLPKIIDMRQFAEGIAQMEVFAPMGSEKLKQRGYPCITGGATTIPFETLCGGRSMPSFFMDLFRIPEKVMKAMDAMLPMYIAMAVESVKASGIKTAWVGGWRTASGLLAPKFWDKFVFPYLRAVVYGLAENGIISILHLDQDWTRDLARFRELPDKMCCLNLDGTTDIRKAKEILGDRMSIMGDVPAQILAAGTPETTYRYVENLIKDIGVTGLLLCPGCDAPINAKHENILSMYEAGRDFGGWKSISSTMGS